MLETCLNTLTLSKIRITERRRLLLDFLHATHSPLAVPDLLKLFLRRRQNINKTTVYRELTRLKSLGLVRETVVNDRKQYYELTEHGHHHHLICTECDRMYDIELPDRMLLHKAEALGQSLRFTLMSHAIDFYGLCVTCMPKMKRARV